MARIRGSVGTTRGFVSGVNQWAQETEERATAVFQEGIKDFYDEMYAATPVDTGNLRNSLVVTKNGQPEMQGPLGPGYANSGTGQSYMVADSIEIGDRVTLGYRATYARRLNLGFTGFDSLGRYYNQAGRFWIEAVGSRYRSIMRAAATRYRMTFK